MADILSAVAGTVVPPGAEPSRNLLMAGVVFLAVMPLCVAVGRDGAELLGAVSRASVIAALAFAGVVGAYGLMGEGGGEYD